MIVYNIKILRTLVHNYMREIVVLALFYNFSNQASLVEVPPKSVNTSIDQICLK